MEKKLKYVDICEDLRNQILEVKIRPGDKLPSENELSATYGVSRQTVRKALEILQNEGYIYAEHGRGTFCSELMRHRKQSKNIAVVTTYLSDYIFPRVIQGIDWVLTENGY
ncbi:MAG: GntR family transcriptional regulator, partial [Eubacterium sp.]|nr:GntR family transcriptional regulator [Eubacterium sp.]